jgi:hypothetical protein
MAKSTSTPKVNSHNDFLQSQSFLFDRVKAGIDIYPNDNELQKFAAIAKEINPSMDFQIKGCQECVQSLISFVYNNINIEIETIPTESEGKE